MSADLPHAENNSLIEPSRWVVGSFLGYAIVAGIFIMNHVGNESAKPQIDQLMDIMKTLLLPIVTLVIGFYFGSKETN